jgi:hypothetical protein
MKPLQKDHQRQRISIHRQDDDKVRALNAWELKEKSRIKGKEKLRQDIHDKKSCRS